MVRPGVMIVAGENFGMGSGRPVGTAFRACGISGLRIMLMMIPGQLNLGDRIAERHPALRLAMDHPRAPL